MQKGPPSTDRRYLAVQTLRPSVPPPGPQISPSASSTVQNPPTLSVPPSPKANLADNCGLRGGGRGGNASRVCPQKGPGTPPRLPAEVQHPAGALGGVPVLILPPPRAEGSAGTAPRDALGEGGAGNALQAVRLRGGCGGGGGGWGTDPCNGGGRGVGAVRPDCGGAGGERRGVWGMDPCDGGAGGA